VPRPVRGSRVPFAGDPRRARTPPRKNCSRFFTFASFAPSRGRLSPIEVVAAPSKRCHFWAPTPQRTPPSAVRTPLDQVLARSCLWFNFRRRRISQTLSESCCRRTLLVRMLRSRSGYGVPPRPSRRGVCGTSVSTLLKSGGAALRHRVSALRNSGSWPVPAEAPIGVRRTPSLFCSWPSGVRLSPEVSISALTLRLSLDARRVAGCW